jgi:hypothetical protein
VIAGVDIPDERRKEEWENVHGYHIDAFIEGKGIDVNFGKLFFQGSEPDSTSFKAMFAAGQKSYLPNEAATNLGVEIRYFDGSGNIYSSFFFHRIGGSGV